MPVIRKVPLIEPTTRKEAGYAQVEASLAMWPTSNGSGAPSSRKSQAGRSAWKGSAESAYTIPTGWSLPSSVATEAKNIVSTRLTRTARGGVVLGADGPNARPARADSSPAGELASS